MLARLSFSLAVSVALVLLGGAPLLGQETPKNPKIKEKEPKIDPKGTYECLLGIYSNDGKVVPFISLSIPDGDNMLTDGVMAQMRGSISLGEISYKASGYIVIPKDGAYDFHQTFEVLKIDGKATGLDRKTGTLDLKKGPHQILLSESNHGQPYLKNAKIVIRPKGESDKIPIVNSGRDIQRFLATPVGGIRTVLVSPIDFAAREIKPEPKQK